MGNSGVEARGHPAPFLTPLCPGPGHSHPGCLALPKPRQLFPDVGLLHMLFPLSGRFFPVGPHMAAHSHSSCLCLNVTAAEVFSDSVTLFFSFNNLYFFCLVLRKVYSCVFICSLVRCLPLPRAHDFCTRCPAQHSVCSRCSIKSSCMSEGRKDTLDWPFPSPGGGREMER